MNPTAMPWRKPHKLPLTRRFHGPTGKRVLWLLGIGMLAFGAAELPALSTMSAHGTSVFGFELAGSTHRLSHILTRWGPNGRGAAEEHVLIDLGFIACYGLLLAGGCGRLATRYEHAGHERMATLATLLAWGSLLAASMNLVQKIVLWLELHGHPTQPLPTLAATCNALTNTLAISAALFAASATIIGNLSSRHSPSRPTRRRRISE